MRRARARLRGNTLRITNVPARRAAHGDLIPDLRNKGQIADFRQVEGRNWLGYKRQRLELDLRATDASPLNNLGRFAETLHRRTGLPGVSDPWRRGGGPVNRKLALRLIADALQGPVNRKNAGD